jgi:hypothetical protein
MSVDLKVDGYEPGLTKRKSTIGAENNRACAETEAGRKLWCRWADSNRRPCAYETHALTG